jgi:23S rRNA U2552 (ribose-2'-O)-methylase RlmE/FtsJ
MNNIKDIAERYDTDKAVHTHYLKNYDAFFQELADRPVRLLELGIKHGGSMLLWRDYFPQGKIVGLDINPVEIDDASGRIVTYQGRQEDRSLLDKIARETAPDGFDIIIDDCSHIGVLTRASFWHLFDNHLKSGGIYVIEDWGTGYWESFLDGVAYKPASRELSPIKYKLTRIAARLQNIPIAGRAASLAKAAILKRQYHSHDYGMVGFVKELIDEIGMNDITHPQFGVGQHRQSKFREMRISTSHLFVVKA